MSSQFKLTLPDEQAIRLNEVAREHEMNADEMLVVAVGEWLEQEIKRKHRREMFQQSDSSPAQSVALGQLSQEERLQRAKQTLLKFSRGIGSSRETDIAQHHDKYLYDKP